MLVERVAQLHQEHLALEGLGLVGREHLVENRKRHVVLGGEDLVPVAGDGFHALHQRLAAIVGGEADRCSAKRRGENRAGVFAPRKCAAVFALPRCCGCCAAAASCDDAVRCSALGTRCHKLLLAWNLLFQRTGERRRSGREARFANRSAHRLDAVRGSCGGSTRRRRSRSDRPRGCCSGAVGGSVGRRRFARRHSRSAAAALVLSYSSPGQRPCLLGDGRRRLVHRSASRPCRCRRRARRGRRSGFARRSYCRNDG